MISGYTDDSGKIRREWETFKNALSVLRKPYHLVPGNHDIWDAESLKIYEGLWGRPYYDFQANGCEFIVLDTEGLDRPGGIDGEQLEWLGKRLEATKGMRRRFVFLHRPLWRDSKSGWNSAARAILAKWKVDVVFAGHEHRFADDGRIDGVRYIITGGAGAPLRGGRGVGAYYHYLLVTVDGKGVSVKVVEPNGGAKEADSSNRHLSDTLEALKYGGPTIRLGERSEPRLRVTLGNAFESPLDFHFGLSFPKGSDWSAPKSVFDVTVEPGGRKNFEMPLSYGGGKVFPLPKMSISLSMNGVMVHRAAAAVPVRIERVLRIARAKGRIDVDGDLKEPDWKDASSSGPWFDMLTGHWVAEPVEFKAVRDDTTLYLSFKCHTDHPIPESGSVRFRDWYVPTEDSVVVAFHSPKISHSKFVLGITSHGVQSDYLASDKSVGFSWNPKWKSAVVRGKGWYVVEMGLPLSLFDNKPLETIGLRINAGRIAFLRKTRKICCWSLPLGGLGNPKGFGACVFDDTRRGTGREK
jgi:hypothetical protein